jgi:glycosyltransferase involved in cell wall biosynthesis
MHICHFTLNPIDYERRIQNQADCASKAGNSICIVALGIPGDVPYEKKDEYTLHRIFIPFHSGGPLKFLHFNLKLLVFGFRKKLQIIHCHDLWVLPAAAILVFIKRCKLIYDAHEYYAGLEIFRHHKIRKKLWMITESLIVGKVDVLLTVSEPLAMLYKKRYARLKRIEVIRNLPLKEKIPDNIEKLLPLSDSRKSILYQGHFRPGRGLLNLIKSLHYVENAHLFLIGGGEMESELRLLVEDNALQEKVTFMGYIPTAKLIQTSRCADLGLVLFEPTSLNYSYALPNKFFEYIMAGLPVLASNIKTFEDYINKYEIGLTVDPSNVQEIAKKIMTMISDDTQMRIWQQKAVKASEELNWESEAIKMNKIYEDFKM